MSGKACSSRYNSSPCSSTESLNPIVKVKPTGTGSSYHLSSMVKKFMEKRSKPKLMIPCDDLKKSRFPNPSKVFGEKKKALTEVKSNSNSRTLAMVLKSERELLTLNKDQELLISELQSQLHQRDLQIEKLKDLCLTQREEIKSLKTAVLFPEDIILDKQPQPQLIPNLQSQISNLTCQLHSLSHHIAQVKPVNLNFSSPNTPIYNSLDFSDEDPTTPDDMLLKDVNPCLTPCYSRIKTKEYTTHQQQQQQQQDKYLYQVRRDSRNMSTSSQHLKNWRVGPGSRCASFRSSDQSKYSKPMDHQ